MIDVILRGGVELRYGVCHERTEMDCAPRRAHRLPQSTLVRIYRPIQGFFMRKWNRDLDYRLIKEVWAFRENRIALRFA